MNITAAPGVFFDLVCERPIKVSTRVTKELCVMNAIAKNAYGGTVSKLVWNEVVKGFKFG